MLTRILKNVSEARIRLRKIQGVRNRRRALRRLGSVVPWRKEPIMTHLPALDWPKCRWRSESA